MLGPAEELDLGSDDEEDEPQLIKRHKKSKQSVRPTKIIPTASDASSSDEESDEDGRTTMANMEARSRALDAEALLDADLDADEMQLAVEAAAAEDDDVEMEGEIDDDGDAFVLPTPQEREEEKSVGGPNVQLVQRRMRECARVLGNFKRFAAKGRSRSEYTDQLIADIASYYGYNDFLAEKLFLLFPVAEVAALRFLFPPPLTLTAPLRPSNSSKRTRSRAR